jgi:hypothetical protein
MPYREDKPIPPGYHVESKMRTGLVIGGSVMLGAGYLISAGIAASAIDDGNSGELAPLFVPVVGPFITLGTLDFSGDFGSLAFIVIGLPLIIDGLVQTAGTIMLVTGLAAPKTVVKRDGSAATDTTPRLRFGGDRILLEGRF